ETAFASLRLDVHTPVRCVDVDIRRNCLAVVADGIERAAHVVDKEPPRSWFVDEQHHPCGFTANVRKGRKLREVYAKWLAVVGNRFRKRIDRLRQRTTGHQQHQRGDAHRTHWVHQVQWVHWVHWVRLLNHEPPNLLNL